MNQVAASEPIKNTLSPLNFFVTNHFIQEKINHSFGSIFNYTDEDDNKYLAEVCRSYYHSVKNFRTYVAQLITNLAAKTPIQDKFCTHETLKDICFPKKGMMSIKSFLYLNSVIVRPGGRKFDGLGQSKDPNHKRLNILSGSITINYGINTLNAVVDLLFDPAACTFSLDDNIVPIYCEISDDKKTVLIEGSSDIQRRFFLFLSTPRGRRPHPGRYDLILFNGKNNTSEFQREKESKKYADVFNLSNCEKIVSISTSPSDQFICKILQYDNTKTTETNKTVEKTITISFDSNTYALECTSNTNEQSLAQSSYCLIGSTHTSLARCKTMLPLLGEYISKKPTSLVFKANYIIHGINADGVHEYCLKIPDKNRLCDKNFLFAAAQGLNNPMCGILDQRCTNYTTMEYDSPNLRYYVAHVWGGGAEEKDITMLNQVKKEINCTISLGGNNILTRLLFGRMHATYSFDGLISYGFNIYNNDNYMSLLKGKGVKMKDFLFGKKKIIAQQLKMSKDEYKLLRTTANNYQNFSEAVKAVHDILYKKTTENVSKIEQKHTLNYFPIKISFFSGPFHVLKKQLLTYFFIPAGITLAGITLAYYARKCRFNSHILSNS